MRKVALVFVTAVFVPSLLLAWLAVRSLRDQQFVLERQRSLLYQGVTDSLAKAITDYLAEQQREFNAQIESMVAETNVRVIATDFDEQIRQRWPLAEVGFCVTLSGSLIAPSPLSRPEARLFCTDNGGFLANKESVEVYWNDLSAANRAGNLSNLRNIGQQQVANSSWPQKSSVAQQDANASDVQGLNSYRTKEAIQSRKVNPMQQVQPGPNYYDPANVGPQSPSKLVPAEAEFAQLVGDSRDGMIARFLQNKLRLMFWRRTDRDPQLVFGAQLDLARVTAGLRELIRVDPALERDICVALLDDNARPVALSHPQFTANWKRPFVATEIGEALPHWEATVYLLNPAKLTESARTLTLTLGLLIAVLVLAIAVGSWLIVTDLNRQLTLARQKTDFVSNVSHELKTPLTSIRMFSELLAERRVTDNARQRAYLNIITAETARLTRLINNVLDFSRIERGEKKYNFQECDLVSVVRETIESYRPHLENNGFRFDCSLPQNGPRVRGDCDALAQIIVNLLSNAEKYSDSRKEIAVEIGAREGPLPCAEVRVLDRGLGVPRGSEQKIFEKFYRAHDSLSSGIQGSGLGLTLARQIARAHGGDVIYEPRDGGGSCFSLRLPVLIESGNDRT